jgi:hypothetical protein
MGDARASGSDLSRPGVQDRLSMLLIHPPAVRCTEPPLGIARLAGLLHGHGVPTRCLDLCREGIDYLLGLPADAEDTWTRGALRRRGRSLALLRDPATYASPDRYRRAVRDLGRALGAVSKPFGAEAGLADYREAARSPLRRSDLLEAAAAFEESPFYPLFRARLAEELAGLPTAIIGLSVNYLSQALPAFAIAGLLRRLHPERRVILGGGLVTSWVAQGSLATDERFGGLVDAVLPGRGEDGILECLGIARRVPAAAPDFGNLVRLDYLAPTRILPYNFSSGCPWKRCSFCPETAEGSRYVGLSVGRAMREIHGLIARHPPGLLHFTDNEIAPLYLRALAESPPGVPWYGFARFSPQLADPDFCRRLAASGCVMLQLGLESADQAVLDALGKGTRLDQIERALQGLDDAGIGVFLYLLFGTPAEDADAARRTRDFVAAWAHRIDFLNVALFNLPVASRQVPDLETRPFYAGELSLYREFSHPRGWNRDTVREFVAAEFGAEPAIRAILARNPPVFTSNHAPFFLASGPGRPAPPPEPDGGDPPRLPGAGGPPARERALARIARDLL